MAESYTNALANETSPYLLQHAHNPVNWVPWGNEAMQQAREQNKLLLISIGYSACHWCHVMEHESFEDEAVAQFMNDHFVCVKVDREERPDVDQVYMDAVQLIAGSGGWPLNCFALPDGRPVYGGTYFSKRQWVSLLQQLIKLHHVEPFKLQQQAQLIAQGVTEQDSRIFKTASEILSSNDLVNAYHNMAKGFDKESGGFNGAPKFPTPVVWQFVLQLMQLSPIPEADRTLQTTLSQMAMGGIYDHVGGGFARYAVDASWHVPHFEKMLYDNAQLIGLYAKAYRQFGNEHYKRVVYETIQFLQRELLSFEGAFFSALDADSEGVEGKFYVWTAEELQEILGKAYPLFAEYYQVTSVGNWEYNKNILHSMEQAEQFAARKEMHLNDFLSDLEMAETKLLYVRKNRVRPALDDKIITSWNALLVRGLVEAFMVFGNPLFLSTAERTAEFIRNKMMHRDGGLFRSYKNGVARIEGCLDDYAFVIHAFIHLYQANFDEQWLLLANALTNHVNENFSDEKTGFYTYASKNEQTLVAVKKEVHDSVMPSSNSVMAENLFDLSVYFGRNDWYEKASAMIRNFSFEIIHYARFYSNWARMAVRLSQPRFEVVVTGPDALKMAKMLQNSTETDALYALATEGSEILLTHQRSDSQNNRIFVCRNNSCSLPVSTVAEAEALLFKYAELPPTQWSGG